MLHIRQSGLEDWRVAFGLVGRDTLRLHARFGDGSFEEALSGRCVPTLAKIDVHHLPMLI